ncbi:hypothetical protein [Herbaspirillum aquaticum]|uniref:hypothetical protein n=1 Tax=Herbaspirillum aquaticum TaxID=568783 RepID=UPI0024DEFAEB|nr:hypothetical protein [Herbaspirillum aquaticum]
MNTIQETKARLRALALAMVTILDNYGVNSNQQPEYNIARQELDDIIANIADTPPPEPVTVESVVSVVAAHIGDLEEKIDGLIALANAHGEAQQAASAA